MAVAWLQQCASEVPPADDWLGPDEQTVLATLRIPKRRSDWRLGRWTAKQALVAAGVISSGIAPWRLEIRAADGGAPQAFLDGTRLVGTAISLSHRDGLAVCAVAADVGALGCDVERIEPRAAVFVRDYFTPAEQALVAVTPAAGRAALVTLVWSAKESIAKALGQGWRLDTRDIEVRMGSRVRGAWTAFGASATDTVRAFDGWWRSLDGWVLTVAASASTLPDPPWALQRRGGRSPGAGPVPAHWRTST